MVPLGDSECRQQRARFEEIGSMSGSRDARLPLKLEQILIETTLLVLGR